MTACLLAMYAAMMELAFIVMQVNIARQATTAHLCAVSTKYVWLGHNQDNQHLASTFTDSIDFRQEIKTTTDTIAAIDVGKYPL